MDDYIITEFRDTGFQRWTAPRHVYSVEYLIVGGGGGGGGAYDTGSSGGGGGGMVLTGTLNVIPNRTYNIYVGKGGKGGTGLTGLNNTTSIHETNGENGENSILHNIVAYGGGGGYKSRFVNNSAGKGGIKQLLEPQIKTTTGGDGGLNRDNTGGGGGGAGGDGGDAGSAGGAGGSGVISDLNIFNNPYEFGKGGKGGDNVDRIVIGISGFKNSGKGGDGGSVVSGSPATQTKIGGDGGSGFIAIRYKPTPRRAFNMFGVDTKKTHTKGYNRGSHTSYSSLGNRRR